MPLKLLQKEPATPAQREVMGAPVEPQFLMDTEMAGPHRTPVKDFDDKSLEGAILESTRIKPQIEQGTPVFADQASAEQMRSDAEPLSFSQAFRAARDSGKTEFKHKGSMFNTRQRDESASDWQEVLKNQKGPMLTDFVAGFERERDVEDIPAAPGPELLSVKNTRTAPTFKQIETMLAPVEMKLLPGPEYLDVVNKRIPETAPLLPEDKQAPARDVTVSLNKLRDDAGLRHLDMNSGYRTPEESARTMMNSVAKAKNWDALVDAGYNHHNYPRLIKAYLADRTPENLQAIGDERLKRENSGLLKGGHGTSDSADYSVRDLTKRSDALERVEWLRSQGLTATLEYWDSEKKDENAHIHVGGINAMYATIMKVN